jgi:Ca2+-binding EF-hand superfamily protein
MRTHLLAAAVLLTLPAVADAQTTRRPADIRFQAMDRNGDRRITRDEWQGSDRSFQVHDWNGDGVLSGSEVQIGARRQDRDVPDYDQGEFRDWTARGFTRLDANQDGRITRNEWRFDREGFFRADQNNDGVLTRAEFLGESVEDDRDDRFAYLDSDNNGRIELDEWHATRAEFRRLDRNGDGRLTRAELGSAEATDSGQSFASLDSNGNGAISFNEWYWSRASFDDRDTNRDGVLSRAEFARTGGAVGTSGVGGRTVRVSALERWTDSGLTVRRGDTIEIDASGTITMSGPTDAATPAGSTSGRRAPESPLPAQPAGGLLIRVGDSQPIFLGANSGSFEAPTAGRIYFGVNDDHLPDNGGEFRVIVRVRN